MSSLTKKQITAVIATIYHELKVIFEEMGSLKKFQDDSVRKKRILEDLSSLLKNSFQHDLQDHSIFKLFEEVKK